MKLTTFKGIAHDLAKHLDNLCFGGYWSDLNFPVSTNAVEEKDTLDKSCVAFVKERISKDFDFSRIKEINVGMVKIETSVDVIVKIKVDDKEFISR